GTPTMRGIGLADFPDDIEPRVDAEPVASETGRDKYSRDAGVEELLDRLVGHPPGFLSCLGAATDPRRDGPDSGEHVLLGRGRRERPRVRHRLLLLSGGATPNQDPHRQCEVKLSVQVRTPSQAVSYCMNGALKFTPETAQPA